MKKPNFGHIAVWYGGVALLAVLVTAIGLVLDIMAVIVSGFLVVGLGAFLVPTILDKRMEKNAARLESSFAQNGFTYQYKFTSNTGIFYIDRGGRLGVIWRGNPTELQFADLTKLSDVRTNNGQQLRGTSLVSCQFRLDGKKYKIYTLRVSNGQFGMKDPRVVEAIEKADNICAMLKEAALSAAEGKLS